MARSGVGENPVWRDAFGADGFVLLVDTAHVYKEQLLSDDSSGVRSRENSDSPVTPGNRTARPP